jgi:molecular chaperone GrpE
MDPENQVQEQQPVEVDESTQEAEVQAAESQLREDMERLQAESEGLRDQLLRTMADFQNFRKRQVEQRQAEQDRLVEGIARELLPILDNFERTVRSIDAGATLDSIREGILSVERQFRTVLANKGVERIESVGKPFDPEIHEALAVEVTAEAEPDTVVIEIEPGYTLNGRTIRPSKVKVAQAP